MITIGQYTISVWTGLDGGFWIEHESGEGMQVKEKVLADLLHKFYVENF